MKILIISLPRTGSSSLLYKLANEYKLKPIFEPFHDGTNTYRDQVYNVNEDDVIVKTIIFHHKNNLDLCKEFDKIILLTRKDLIACSESYAYFVKNVGKNFKSYYEYVYENVNEFEFKKACDFIKKCNDDLNILSEKLNTPLTYYEDIFNKDSDERLRKFKKSKII